MSASGRYDVVVHRPRDRASSEAGLAEIGDQRRNTANSQTTGLVPPLASMSQVRACRTHARSIERVWNMQSFTYTVDERMQRFVSQLGNLPLGARRLHDFEARQHGAQWVQRLVGKGVACSYVIGYQHADCWWTWFFDRRSADSSPAHCEVWVVESYESTGLGSSHTYCFIPHSGSWKRFADCRGPTTESAAPPTSAAFE